MTDPIAPATAQDSSEAIVSNNIAQVTDIAADAMIKAM